MAAHITFPVPTIKTVPSLINLDHVAVELELLKNPLQLSRWLDYIKTVKQSVEADEMLLRGVTLANDDNDAVTGSAGLDGRLAHASTRLGLQRIVDVYERALVHFPSSFTLWSTYLATRSAYLMGTATKPLKLNAPKSNYAAERTISDYLRAGLGNVPELEDGERDVESGWKLEESLSSILGWEEWRSLVAVHERALMWLPNFPRIWLSLLTVFGHPSCPAPLSHSHARKTFDRALRTLPPTLHARIWRVYLQWAETRGGETGVRVWRRYLKLDPAPTHYYTNLLLSPSFLTSSESASTVASTSAPTPARPLEAAKLLLGLAIRAREGTYVSPEAKSGYQLLVEWMDVCEKYAEEVGIDLEESERSEAERNLKLVEASEAGNDDAAMQDEVGAAFAGLAKGKTTQLVRLGSLTTNGASTSNGSTPSSTSLSKAVLPTVVDNSISSAIDPLSAELLDVSHLLHLHGLAHYPDQSGPLYSSLATYWIKRAEFQHARDVFEGAYKRVVTLRDFSIVFDAGVEFEESVISNLMDTMAEEIDEDEADDVEERKETEGELDERMAYFEELMDRRPFLVNEVLLRRNPNDVQEWEKRVVLFGSDKAKVVETYTKALSIIAPRKATVGLHSLWIHFAKYYETSAPESDKSGIQNARKVFERATHVPFKKVEELAEIWCEFAEMEVRNENYAEAIQVMQRATTVPRKTAINFHDETLSPQSRLFKSLKLWSFYVDLEESIGTVQSTKAVYEKIFELKVANAQIVVNFAEFLEEGGFWEESFKVYERGVDLFSYPIAFEIWNTYLSKFIKRYEGDKIERARDLFEQALESCPAKFAKPLYLMYGQLEEEHGLAKRAMNVYDRATRAVEAADRLEMFTYYIAKATSNFGLPATRPIYERAIESLPDRQTAEMCMRFASLERKLGEIDRARAIFAHASQFCDPRSNTQFWATWNSFEIETGSEDTFREYLRIKRAVQSAFNTESSYLAAKAAAALSGEVAAAESGAAGADAGGDPMAAMDKATGGFVKAKEGGLKGAGGEDAAAAEVGNSDEIMLDDDDDDDDE